MLKIPKNKGERCPICNFVIKKPNNWVKYHISYKPEMCVLACKYCNYVEYGLRTQKVDYRTKGAFSKKRVDRVIKYQKKFGIVI